MGGALAAVLVGPRAVVLSEGIVAAQGRNLDIPTNDELMKSHQLELPYGFDPHSW